MMIRISLFFLATLLFLVTYLEYYRLYLIGFPDGHKTAYQQAIVSYWILGNWINFITATLLLVFAIVFYRRLTWIKILISSLVFVSLMAIYYYSIHYYFGEVLLLEDGWGG